MGGGDKARIRIGGVTILQRALACLTPQCSGVIINANGDPARFADTALPVIADSVPDFAGRLPAARIAAAAPLACARSGEWRQPVVGLWPVTLREDLRRALTREG